MTRYRDTATGETYDEDAMEDLLLVDIGNLEAKDASGLTSASSLEMLRNCRFEEVEDEQHDAG